MLVLRSGWTQAADVPEPGKETQRDVGKALTTSAKRDSFFLQAAVEKRVGQAALH